MDEKIVHRWLFTTQWERLFGGPRHTWKKLTSYYIRCDVAGGVHLAEGACKPNMFIHSLSNMGSFCTCWATACCTRRQFWGLDNKGTISLFLAAKHFLSSSKHAHNL
jgi:hypothetical protein